MALAPTVAKVGNLGEDLDEGRRLCYHKSLPSDRVLVHAGRARQAGSHVEQTPLTCFGPVVQPHLRKLNDLGNPSAPLQSVLTRRPTAATCWRMLRLTRSMK